MKKYPLLGLCILLLSACSSAYTYVQPTGDMPMAYLVGQNDRDMLLTPTWIFAKAEAIDNKVLQTDLATHMLVSPGRAEFRISPGEHDVLVFTKFNREFFGTCPCETFTEIKAQFEEGKRYRVVSAVKGASIHSWIEEEETKSKTSTVGVANYRPSPRNTVVYMPASK